LIVTLYRYQDPTDLSKTLYVGQGAKRDRVHRAERSSFGRRFRRRFPGQKLPQPIRWTVEVANQLELNELETIAMFQYRSWHGYGGMNLGLPGSTDYPTLNSAIPHEDRVRNGRIGGLKGGLVSGRNARENHTGICGMTPQQRREAGRRSHALHPDLAIAWGRKLGRKAATNGQLAIARSKINPEKLRAAARANARKRVESGRWAEIAGLGLHYRWHIKRGVSKPETCELCWKVA
jgi:hypothetical protein